MKIRAQAGLPYVAVTLVHNGRELHLENVVLDTGAAISIFRTDDLAQIGLVLEPHDTLHEVHGIGGSEFVIVKQVDEVKVGSLSLPKMMVDMGAMDYQFELDGLLGFDFLQAVGATIDFAEMEIY